MKIIFICLTSAMLFQSCCVYKETIYEQDRNVTELGFAPYGSRPIDKEINNHGE